jgi:hypothetical protein
MTLQAELIAEIAILSDRQKDAWNDALYLGWTTATDKAYFVRSNRLALLRARLSAIESELKSWN